MKRRADPFGDSLVQEVKERRAFEAEVRDEGHVLVTPPQVEYLVKLTAHLGDDEDTGQPSYVGDMQEAPFLKFRETPSDENADEVPPILSTNNFAVLDDTVTERFVYARPATNSEGEQTWWFTYIESLPAGGANDMVLHRDDFGTAYWEYIHIVY